MTGDFEVQVVDGRSLFSLIENGRCHGWWLEDLFAAASGKAYRQATLEELEILDTDIWFRGTDSRPTVKNMIAEFRRIERADCSFPVLVVTSIGLIDGSHRVAKAYLRGLTCLPCVELSLDELWAVPHETSAAPEPDRDSSCLTETA